MSWFKKFSDNDRERIENNIARLVSLKDRIHKLSYFVFASNGGAFLELEKILNTPLVKGRGKLHEKLKEAFIGKYRQKIALDNPAKFQGILSAAEAIIDIEINKENKELKKYKPEKKNVRK